MTLQERMAELMGRHPGLSQADITRIARVSTATVSDWCNGPTKSMKAEPARLLSLHVGCDQNWLMTGVGVAAWRPAGTPQPSGPSPAPHSAPPTLRQALIAIRYQIKDGRGEARDAIGDALKLMAKAPDSDIVFDDALRLLEKSRS